MNILQQNQDGVQIRLTPDEIIAISNALNESLENIEEWEFETRMGVTRVETTALLAVFRHIRTNQE